MGSSGATYHRLSPSSGHYPPCLLVVQLWPGLLTLRRADRPLSAILFS